MNLLRILHFFELERTLRFTWHNSLVFKSGSDMWLFKVTEVMNWKAFRLSIGLALGGSTWLNMAVEVPCVKGRCDDVHNLRGASSAKKLHQKTSSRFCLLPCWIEEVTPTLSQSVARGLGLSNRSGLILLLGVVMFPWGVDTKTKLGFPNSESKRE